MKKSMFPIGAVVALMITAIGCGRARNEVVAIPKTKSYHTDACPRVFMAETKSIPAEDARTLHYAPCKGCKPDRNSK